MYAIHNIDFLLYSEMMEGRKHDSLNTARDLKNAVPIEVVKAMPMGEVMWPKLYFAMARFGEWDDILAEPAPPKEFAIHHRDVALRARARIRGQRKTG